MQQELELYTPSDVDFAFELISSVITKTVSKVSGNTPFVYLLAGQPGAGKSVLSDKIISQNGRNVIVVNGDDYRRYHPCYRELYKIYGADSVKKTSSFSAAIVQRCIKEFSNNQYNMIIEGTGRTYEAPRNTADLLASKGYKVEMAVIAARPEVSLLSTIKRFFQMESDNTVPRATAIEAHDVVVKNLPENLDKLYNTAFISRIRIMDREAVLLYDSAETDSLPGDALLNYWNRPWTDTELNTVLDEIDKLEEIESRKNLGMGDIISELRRRVTGREDDPGTEIPESEDSIEY